MKQLFIAALGCVIGASAFSQVVGGHGNSEPTPKAAQPASISAGGFAGDVNLFTGDYGATIPIGGVSTPGGLGFNLSYEYSSAFTVGVTPPISTGIPYGEGWNLNIPTISIETEVFNNFTQQQYCDENNEAISAKLDFGTVSAKQEGDLYWFSPFVNIPGVASGRAIFKYIDVADNQTAVFVMNAFESQVELRFNRSGWKVITADGTQYVFSTAMQSANAPANRRVLFYNQSALNTATNIARSVADSIYGVHNEAVANSITPKTSYNLWYCDEIRNLNLKEQNILFVYEKFGAFNYFKEFQQEAYKTAAATLFQNSTFATDNDYTFYTDIILKRIESHAVNSMVQMLKLNYETNKAIVNANPELMPYYNPNFDGGRLDSLYTYKVVYQDGVTGNFSSNWKRYQHLRANANTMGSTLDATNPYLSSSGYVRSGTGGTSSIKFEHSFLETPRILTGNYDLIPGDLYEVRTTISRSGATDLEMGNGTVDIAVVTGNNNNPTGSNSITTTYNDLNNNTGIYYPLSDYEDTRGIPLYSTFNMALKWTLSYAEGMKHTSNLFVMPNIPSKFGGINIQVGPGNADVNHAATPGAIDDLVSNNIPDAKAAYVFRNNGRTMKSAADVSGAFGVGLPWGMMIPVYKNMVTILNATTYSGGTGNEAFKFWWTNNPSLYNYANEPTKLDSTVKLEDLQLIRYTKNPYMLATAELYQVNGEINAPGNPGLKLIAKKKMEYTSKRTQLIENYDYTSGQQLKYKNASQARQVHILLKAVRDIPVDGTTDTTKFLTTFLDYSTYTSADSTYSLTNPLNGHKGFLLTTFTDHLGGITKVEYYPPTDSRTYFTQRYTFNQTCNSSISTQPFGTNKASTIHPVVQYVLKNDELDLVKNGSPSSNSLHKRWRYDFDASSRVKKETDLSNNDVNHFHHGRKSSYSTGFKTVSVFGPTLTDGGTFINKTVYEHYGHELTSGSGSPTDEDYLLHGKIKSIKEYDVTGKIFTEKIFNYGYTLAFKNGYTRPNPYKEDIIWDQDFDNPGGHYEYRDYYLNQPVSVTTGGNTYTGTNAYPYLTIPVFNGTGESKELPKFLDFAFYPNLLSANSLVELNSYFIKKTEEISRTYDDYLYKQATQSPIVIPVVVSTLPNPFGGGHTNTVGYLKSRDSVYMVNIATGVPKDVLTALITASPLSDTVLKTMISSTRFTGIQKAQLLKSQPDLSNNVWKHTLTNQGNFSATDLIDLVNKQTYFSDAILTHAINNMSSRWDQLFVEKLFLKNEYLSHPVLQNLIASTNYISGGTITNILSKQPQMQGSVLNSIITGTKVPKTSLGTIFKYQTMTDTLFNTLNSTTGVTNTSITEIIENGLSYPNEATFLSLINRNFSSAEMQRIVAMANRQLETSIINQLKTKYNKESWPNNIVYNGNPLSQYCNVATQAGWSYIENKTTYEYYEADYRGVAQGRAYKVLMGLEDIPNRTVSLTDVFGAGGTKTVSTLNLKHEPSWQVFAVTTSSVHLPDAKQEQQFFYLYDLRNRYDRYWYNYDFKTVNGESTPFGVAIEELDTIGYTGRWGTYYASQYANGNFDIPKYDGMTKSRQYNLRSTPFQKTTLSKSQRNEPVMARSEYYFYDARWRFDDLTIDLDTFPGPTCPEVPPTPTPSDCEQCMYWKYGLENDLLNSLPNNYCLWQDDVVGFYACPYGIDASQCFPGATLINCNPSLPENQIPDPQRYMQLSDALGKSLQLRSTVVQLDTIMGTLNNTFATKRTDRSNKYVAEFRMIPNTPDPNGFDGIYTMVYPFDTLTTTTVKERNHYFQPALTVNQAGIKTRYYYNMPQQYWNMNGNCNNPAYNFLYNYSSVDARDIGLPYRVTVGYQRNDSLSSTFEFTNDGQVKKTTNPSGHYFEYTFDGFNRLSTVKENGGLLSRNAYNQWNHNGTLSFNDRIDQNYVYSVLYNEASDTTKKEHQKAFLDPLGRTAGAMKMYNVSANVDQKIYTGTPTYDSWGRTIQTRKPFVTTNSGMIYRSNAVNNVAYSTTKYENDPGSLAIRQSDIGTAITSSHVVRTKTWIVNNIYASCELGLTNYELQQVMKSGSTTDFRFKRTSVIDQDSNETVVYLNAFGQKIATLGWSNLNDKVVTLFIYDNYGNLTKTINAKRQETEYRYNILGQLYMELTVDGGNKRYLYNKLGQISAVQDQLDRDFKNGSGISTPRHRKFTYDAYGKPTGQYWVTSTYPQDAFLFKTSSVGQYGNWYYDAQNQPNYLRYTMSNRMTMDWINRYTTINDNPNALDTIVAIGLPGATTTVTEKTTTYGTSPAFPLLLGKVVEIKSFHNNVAVQKITFSYDSKERVASQVIRQHPTNEATNDNRLITAKIDYPAYNLRGSLQEERLDMGNDGSVEMLYYYRYDPLNRLTDVRVAQDGNTAYGSATAIAGYVYSDTTNAVVSVKYSASGNSNIQTINYAYDIRDRLKSINSELMNYNLYYDNQDPAVYNNDVVTAMGTHYNGNIRASRVQYNFGSALVYNASSLAGLFSYETTYGYTYDKLNRLTFADAAVGDNMQAQLNNPSNPTPEDGEKVGDEIINYDKIGNITNLVRFAKAANMNLGFTSDQYAYIYQNGTNRLVQADGYSGTPDRNYTYDANGNLLTDDSKLISTTQYVRGSYANQITKTGGDQITYQYDAGDLRFYKKVVASSVTTEEMYLKDVMGHELAIVKWVGNGSPTTEYYVHGTNRIAMITNVSGAQVTPNEATFFLYDHLGNTRVAFRYDNSLPTVVNALDYYPYGKILRESDFGNGDRYLTTAHERDRETGLDYRGARYYDSDVARFLSLDPLASKFPAYSLYNYVLGNPIILVDNNGKAPTPVDEKPHAIWTPGRWVSSNITANSVVVSKNLALMSLGKTFDYHESFVKTIKDENLRHYMIGSGFDPGPKGYYLGSTWSSSEYQTSIENIDGQEYLTTKQIDKKALLYYDNPEDKKERKHGLVYYQHETKVSIISRQKILKNTDNELTLDIDFESRGPGAGSYTTTIDVSKSLTGMSFIDALSFLQKSVGVEGAEIAMDHAQNNSEYLMSALKAVAGNELGKTRETYEKFNKE